MQRCDERLPWQSTSPRLVLASGSASRRALLASCGLSFEVVPPDLDEGEIKRALRDAGRGGGDTALTLAVAKAERVTTSHPDALVLAADQILSCEGRWFDKPRDLDDARRQLRQLRGRRQVLHTGAVLFRGVEEVWRHLAEPVIVLRDASDALIDAYVRSEGEALLGTVGACRVEGLGQHLIDSIDGEHAAILGVPLLALLEALRRQGVVRL